MAATVADAPTVPETSVTEFDTKLTLSWTAPINTGGNLVLIDGYKVIIQHYDGVTFSEAPSALCGNFDAGVVSTQSCKVEMAELRVHPFFLQQGE